MLVQGVVEIQDSKTLTSYTLAIFAVGDDTMTTSYSDFIFRDIYIYIGCGPLTVTVGNDGL